MAKTNVKNSGEKTFKPNVGLWPSKNGVGFGALITEKVMQDLEKAEVGGRLYLQEVPEAEREKNEKAPHYRIVIFSPDDNFKPRTADDSL